jgi:hypothetical protein
MNGGQKKRRKSIREAERLNGRWLSSGMPRRVVCEKFTDVSEILPTFVVREIGLTTQKRAIFILATLRTSIPTKF